MPAGLRESSTALPAPPRVCAPGQGLEEAVTEIAHPEEPSLRREVWELLHAALWRVPRAVWGLLTEPWREPPQEPWPSPEELDQHRAVLEASLAALQPYSHTSDT